MVTEPEFTVVIATRNRRRLLERAIRSVLAQDRNTEIIVLDDGSTDGTREHVAAAFPMVRVQSGAHGGPGAARNAGLQLARAAQIVVLDDDDELRPGALATIAERLAQFEPRDRYPAYLFRYQNGRPAAAFQVFDAEQFCAGVGDFLTVWNRDVMRNDATVCRYPESRVGAEGLMWLTIGDRYGVPAWGDAVAVVHRDAPERLTGAASQLRHAAEHARIQDHYVDFLQRRPPTKELDRVMTRRLLAAGIYHVLAGNRHEALVRVRTLLRRSVLRGLLLLAACVAPRRLLAASLRAYRG